ncbi:hypothetical protein ACOALA_20845 (plasmid) [Alicyclobacillus acidoterrestris]|uniref:hypothetical protein n=1 Tax=Alicyclobacillus acidoterrestris TaxID=1450 RepID=UPI003F52AA7E
MRRLILLSSLIVAISTISGCATQNQNSQLSSLTQNTISQDPSFKNYVTPVINYLNSKVGRFSNLNIFQTKSVDQSDQIASFTYDFNGHSYEGSALLNKNSDGKWNVFFSSPKNTITNKKFTIYNMSGTTEQNSKYFLLAGTVNDKSISAIRITLFNNQIAQIQLGNGQTHYAYIQTGHSTGVMHVQGINNSGKVIATAY